MAGGVHGRRCACQGRGACMAGGHGWQGGVWWGACIEGGYAWWGTCIAGDVHDGELCVWQGVCMAGGGVRAGETATEAGGTHPTGMYSWLILLFQQGTYAAPLTAVTPVLFVALCGLIPVWQEDPCWIRSDTSWMIYF